jgi:hypothetical protein
LTSFLNRKEARLKPLAVKLSHRRASFAGRARNGRTERVTGLSPGSERFFLFSLSNHYYV